MRLLSPRYRLILVGSTTGTATGSSKGLNGYMAFILYSVAGLACKYYLYAANLC